MTQNTFHHVLDRHFKMNKDYAFDVLQDLCDAESVIFIPFAFILFSNYRENHCLFFFLGSP